MSDKGWLGVGFSLVLHRLYLVVHICWTTRKPTPRNYSCRSGTKGGNETHHKQTTMTSGHFLYLLTRLKVKIQAKVRTPNKPLLLLLAMGNLCRGKPRLLPYKNIANRWYDLLVRFGPYKDRPQPQQPFYRLPRDGLWEIHGDVPSETGDGAPSHGNLLTSNVSGGLPEEVHSLLVAHPETLWAGAQYLLDIYFAESFHDDLLAEVGIHRATQLASKNRKRNPEFRREVIRAYEHRCAICDYDIRLDNNLMGVEAAHIRWHAYDGPDEVPNGLALCTLHHKAFDLGGISLLDDLRLIVSDDLHGQNRAFHLWFLDHSGKPIRAPRHDDQRPDPIFLRWHRKKVFQGANDEQKSGS